MRDKFSSGDESGQLNDSIWSVVAGVVKGFNVSFEYALYDLSYQNMILYTATLPTYDSKEKKNRGGKQERIKADDPRNRDRVHSFLANLKD